jgi:hypothetical protein
VDPRRRNAVPPRHRIGRTPRASQPNRNGNRNTEVTATPQTDQFRTRGSRQTGVSCTPVGRWRGARRRRVLFQRPPVRTPRASFPSTRLSNDYAVTGAVMLPWWMA